MKPAPAGARRIVAFLPIAVAAIATSPASAGITDLVGFDQHLGSTLPGPLRLRDETGQSHRLEEFWADRPAILTFGYFRCPQLCSIVTDGTIGALRQLQPSVGPDFAFVFVSIDPTDTPELARERKTRDVRRYGRPHLGAAGWHYLTADAATIRQLTAAAGFRFAYDPRSGQYAHPSGFIVVTREGKISRYFLGIDFAPREVAAALREAAGGKVGRSVFDLLLVCFHGDGISGRYGPLIWRVLQVAVFSTVLALAGGVVWMLRQERRRARELSAEPEET